MKALSLRGGHHADEAIPEKQDYPYAEILFLVLFLFFPFALTLHAADFQLTTPAFKEGEIIPRKYTCDGENISPPLQWSAAPANTQSFALIADDPDVPAGVWTHWTIFDLPPTINDLPEALPPIDRLANGEIHGRNDFKKNGYGGPCPPQGEHRYFFKLYALDTALRLEPGVTAKGLREAMQGHILAETSLMGRYQRAKG